MKLEIKALDCDMAYKRIHNDIGRIGVFDEDRHVAIFFDMADAELFVRAKEEARRNTKTYCKGCRCEVHSDHLVDGFCSDTCALNYVKPAFFSNREVIAELEEAILSTPDILLGGPHPELSGEEKRRIESNFQAFMNRNCPEDAAVKPDVVLGPDPSV